VIIGLLSRERGRAAHHAEMEHVTIALPSDK
jgi:hypothetical protein